MPYRITVMMKKLDSITEEDFHEYWSKTHSSVFLTVPTAQKLLLKYSQYHISRPLTTALRTSAQAPALNSEFDGAAEFWVNELEDFTAIFVDEVYVRDVVPDEERFMKRDETWMFVGREEEKFEGKKTE
ncbi:EthD domain-containing protein [Phaeosphaeria sp. MPI-PUGE-AT-0046c]|nr:EthD domain-containing protein [Phaeosphaeria sp. MPI-PUGE-AT-0046c]